MTIRIRTVQAILCGLILLTSECAMAQAAAPSDEDTARAAIIARFEALQNITVDYQLNIESFRRGPKINATLPNGLHVRSMVEPQKYQKTFSFLHGNALWESTASKETTNAYKALNINFSAYTLSTSKEGRLEFLDKKIFDKAPGGVIENGCVPSVVDIGLGLRACLRRVIL